MRVCQIIAELRAQQGMTQEQLAERLFVSRDLVSKWETGARRPGREHVRAMAELFGVETDAIVPRAERLTRELSDCFPPGCDVSPTLNAFLDTLGERDRSVFLRRYYHLEEFDEIGAFFGLTPGHVRTILSRTRKKLARFAKEARP